MQDDFSPSIKWDVRANDMVNRNLSKFKVREGCPHLKTWSNLRSRAHGIPLTKLQKA